MPSVLTMQFYQKIKLFQSYARTFVKMQIKLIKATIDRNALQTTACQPGPPP